MTRPIRFWLILAAGLMLAPLPALAQGRGHGPEGRTRDKAEIERHDRDHDRNHRRDDDRDRDGNNDRDDHHGRNFHSSSHGPASRPPGWDRGRKTGWGNCDEPPGLAKKDGCPSAAVVLHRHHTSRTTQAGVTAKASATASVRTSLPASHAPTPSRQANPPRR